MFRRVALVLHLLIALVAAPALVLPLSGAASAATPTLDGFRLGHLPPSLGRASDFTYEWHDVHFVSRVWESGPDGDGAYHVDLQVDVLRGDALASRAGLYRFLADYEQRPSAQWRFVRFRVHGHPGYLGRDEAFWLVRPGVAVLARIDRDRYGPGQLLATCWGVRTVRT